MGKVFLALKGMGFRAVQARQAIAEVEKMHEQTPTVEEALREALLVATAKCASKAAGASSRARESVGCAVSGMSDSVKAFVEKWAASGSFADFRRTFAAQTVRRSRSRAIFC
jgi:hypothetical protein